MGAPLTSDRQRPPVNLQHWPLVPSQLPLPGCNDPPEGCCIKAASIIKEGGEAGIHPVHANIRRIVALNGPSLQRDGVGKVVGFARCLPEAAASC